MSISTLLLLADGRFPAGGHAHSSGLEAAVTAGRVGDLATLESFLRGRLATSGLVAAAFAAAARHGAAEPDRLGQLDAELDARTVAPALRLASRRQGRALLRAGRSTWPADFYSALASCRDGPHQAVALGVIAAAAGLSEHDAALVAAYGQLTGQASAGLRLLGLDPYRMQSMLARLAPRCDAVAAEAAGCAGKSPDELPMLSAPLADITAEIHATWEVRLFAS